MHENLKEQIKALTPETLAAYGAVEVANDGKSYVCIYCGNGTGSKGHGVIPSFENGTWLWHCFSCNKGYDNISILANFYGLDARADFVEICSRACDDFNIVDADIDFCTGVDRAEKTKTDDENKLKEIEIIKADIAAAQSHLGKLPLDQRRGLNIETLTKYHCGYLTGWRSPKSRLAGKYATPTPRLIIPAGNHYLARLTVPVETFDAEAQKFIQPKQHAGDKVPFGVEFITAATEIVIVTEGEIDAMSIWQALNYDPAIIPVATMGAACSKEIFARLIAALKDFKPNILVLFDNDDAGKTNAPKLCNSLVDAGYPAIADFLSGGDEKIDANNILIQGGDEFLKEWLLSTIEDKQEQFIALAAKITDAENLKKSIAAFESQKGKIAPATLAEIKEAAEYLKLAKISPAITNSTRTLKALAQCTFYDFYKSVADDFLARVATARATGVKDVPALSYLQRDIRQEIFFIKDRHLKYQNQLAQFEYQRRQRQGQNKQRKNLAKLEDLRNEPPTPARDKEICQLIKQSLTFNYDRNGKPTTARASQLNYDLIFANDPVMKNLFAYDEFNNAITLLRCPFWRDSISKNQCWSDSDDANARAYLRRVYADIGGDNIFNDTVISFAYQRRFNAVQDYFRNLPKWDGKPRAETLFIDYLKVDDTPFARAVTFKWLLAAVARIFFPACSFQSALVLQGNQNIGKSYILEKLGGDWYGALNDSVDDTHAIDAIKKLWVVELKEMAAARKSEINATKSFIERSSDTYRAAYAKHAETFKRHCVFAITVNDKQFLRDLTGNRRYWILESPLAEFEIIKGLTGETIKQIWSEVYQQFKTLTADGFDDDILDLPLEFKQQAEVIAKRFTADDGLDGEISAFLDVKIPPLVVWNTLTQEEKKKYFEHNQLEIAEGTLYARGKTLSGAAKEEFDNLLDKIDKTQVTRGKDTRPELIYLLRGVVSRNETCASEIYNEYFSGGDKRKQIFRIAETLDRLAGWGYKATRRKNFNGYGHQRGFYYRLKPITDDSLDPDIVDTPSPNVPF